MSLANSRAAPFVISHMSAASVRAIGSELYQQPRKRIGCVCKRTRVVVATHFLRGGTNGPRRTGARGRDGDARKEQRRRVLSRKLTRFRREAPARPLILTPRAERRIAQSARARIR